MHAHACNIKGNHLYPGSPLKASTEPLDRMVSPVDRSLARAHSPILKKPALRAASDGPSPGTHDRTR